MRKAVLLQSIVVVLFLTGATLAEEAAQFQAVAPGIWKVRLGTPEPLTPVAVLKLAPKVDALSALPASQPPIAPTQIGFCKIARGCVVELPMTPEEQIYGFGMNQAVFNSTNLKRTIRISDNPDIADSHAPVPFYVSNRGYGVFVDSARYVNFYCGNLAPTESAAKSTTNDKIATNVDDLYKTRELSSKRMTIEIPAAAGVDLYVFAGPDMKAAVQRYNLFCGGGCLPPMWGLGVCYRGKSDMPGAYFEKLAADLRESHIPFDSFGLEPGWQSKTYSCSFVWSKERYPDPEAFQKKMQELHFHVNAWEHAFANPAAPFFNELKPYSGNYLVWNGLVPDFATDQAKRIFVGYHSKNLMQKGVDGFKLDECDHQPVSTTPWSFPELSRFPSGLDGEQMHLLLGVLYQKALMDEYHKLNRRSLFQVRASFAGASPLASVIYSDSYNHRSYVRAMATCGFGGILWVPEVRESGSTAELFHRAALTMFSPAPLINAWYLKNPPWRQINMDKNNRDELMENWKQNEQTFRKQAQTRMSLLPYLYSAFANYYYTGVPPFRAVVMDYPNDPKVFGLDDEYLMGESILVAPLLESSQIRDVYLPAGDWYCFWTNRKYVGGRSYAVSSLGGQIPVFVKGGSLLPLAKPVEFVTKETVFEITVKAYGQKCRDFTLYEDDGESFDFEKGLQNRLELKYSGGPTGDVKKTGSYTASRYKIVGWQPLE